MMKVIDCRIMARHEALYWLYFLRAYRKAHGYTIEQLARRSGVSRATVWQLENERRPARLPTCRKLADALGVTVERLIETEPPALAA